MQEEFISTEKIKTICNENCFSYNENMLNALRIALEIRYKNLTNKFVSYRDLYDVFDGRLTKNEFSMGFDQLFDILMIDGEFIWDKNNRCSKYYYTTGSPYEYLLDSILEDIYKEEQIDNNKRGKETIIETIKMLKIEKII